MKPELLLFALVFLGSCCYKSSCVYPVEQSRVTIRYQNYTKQDVKDLRIYITDSNWQVVDSIRNFDADTVLYVHHEMLPPSAANSGIFISSIAGRRDTISNIKCDTLVRREKCGNCPGADNHQNVTRYQNTRFDHNGSQHTSDVLVVRK